MPTVSVSTVHLHGLAGTTRTVLATTSGTPATTSAAITLTTGPGHQEAAITEVLTTALAAAGHPVNQPVTLSVAPEGSYPTEISVLALATAVLAATGPLATDRLADTAVVGDVYLDGTTRPVLGVLPAVLAARDHGIRQVIVPTEQLEDAALAPDVDVLGADSLSQVAAWLAGTGILTRPADPDAVLPPGPALAAPVQRAVEIAAAGGHHVLLHTARNAGVLLVAGWLRALRPDLSAEQQFDQTVIGSLLGPREDFTSPPTRPPMAVTGHNGAMSALLGGGVPARPGAVTRAHHGILLATDLHDFPVARAEALRAVLLEREVRMTRVGELLRYPARFQLFASIACCQCGPLPGRHCICAPVQRRRFRDRLPRPLLNLIDVRIPASTAGGDSAFRDDEPVDEGQVLAQARVRVAAARTRAADRWRSAGAESDALTNADVPAELLRTLALPAEVTDPIEAALAAGTLSRHGAVGVRRLAITAADLDGDETPSARHVFEALRLRQATTASTARC
jgi:magnesium chelatase family protein